MMKNNNIPNIPAEKFAFIGVDAKIHDQKFETKQISYFRDAFRRFCRNKSSVAASIIIIVLVLFAIVTPILSPYAVSYNDSYYSLGFHSLGLLFNTTYHWRLTRCSLLCQFYYIDFRAVPVPIINHSAFSVAIFAITIRSIRTSKERNRKYTYG